MFQLDTFVVEGHQKIIDHYRWLRDTSRSEAERECFRRRMVEEYEAFRHYTERHRRGAQRAAA